MKLSNENEIDIEDQENLRKKKFIEDVAETIKILVKPEEVKKMINTNREAGIKCNNIQVYKISFDLKFNFNRWIEYTINKQDKILEIIIDGRLNVCLISLVIMLIVLSENLCETINWLNTKINELVLLTKDDQVFEISKNIIQNIEDNGVENKNYTIVEISKVVFDRNINTQDCELLKKCENTIKELMKKKN